MALTLCLLNTSYWDLRLTRGPWDNNVTTWDTVLLIQSGGPCHVGYILSRRSLEVYVVCLRRLAMLCVAFITTISIFPWLSMPLTSGFFWCLPICNTMAHSTGIQCSPIVRLRACIRKFTKMPIMLDCLAPPFLPRKMP